MTSATIAPALRDHVGRKAIAGRPVAAHGDLFRASMVGLAAFLLSLQFFPLYTQGDQYFYTLAYDLSAGAPFGDVQETYRLWTGSSEPVFVLIMFLLQLIAGKIVASSIINGLLSAGTYLVCKKLRIPIPLMCLGFCSLYYLVLLFSAERLGLAFTFLAYGALVSGKSRGLSSLSQC